MESEGCSMSSDMSDVISKQLHSQDSAGKNSPPDLTEEDDKCWRDNKAESFGDGSCNAQLNELDGTHSGIQTKTNGMGKETEVLGKDESCNGGRGSPIGNRKCNSQAGKNESLSSVCSSTSSRTEEFQKMEITADIPTQSKIDIVTHDDTPKCLSDLVEKKTAIEKCSKTIFEEDEMSTAVDKFSKDSEKFQTNPPVRLNDDADDAYLGNRSESGAIPSCFQQQTPRSDNSCNLTKTKAEEPSKMKESFVPASCDSNLPIDMSMGSTERKHLSTENQKNVKNEAKTKCDSLRPVGRLLHDLGLDLVRQQVYKDLISLQEAKDTKNMLDEKEKEQLKRLTDAHSKLLIKNIMYHIPFIQCRCSFLASSTNVMALHHEFGSTFEVPFHACCLCENFKTRWPSQFLAHVDTLHQKKGRVQIKMASNVCKYCPYEHKNQTRMEVHVAKCFKKFNLNTNLQPLPADCDVPLLGKTSQPALSQSVRPGIMTGPMTFSTPQTAHVSAQIPKQIVAPSASLGIQPSVMEIGGQLYSLVHHNGKALFTSLRSQIVTNTSGSSQNSNVPSTTVIPGNFPRFVQPPVKPVTKDHSAHSAPSSLRRQKCEMCDAVVNDRESLWNHFRVLHKVELSKVSMIEKEPWMTCDVCLAKFWTYQGLTRHSMQLHKRELTPTGMPTKTFKCFLCLQVQTNPLNHLSTYHNITLLDMYQSRRCCMCNRRFRAAPAFEEHMVLQHHDIFANKDVLCTVLQALSTALSLKRQETVQQRAPTVATSLKTGQRGSIIHNQGSGQVTIAHSLALASSQRPLAEAPSLSKGQPDIRKKGAPKRQPGNRPKVNEPSTTIKTSPKKSSEEAAKELNKLYTEYADIGRPILRSMRQRLSQSGMDKASTASFTASNANVCDKSGTDSAKPEVDGPLAGQDLVAETKSDEPSAKRLCLESCRNNVQPNDISSTVQHKQLQEFNGETANVIDQKAS